MGGKSVETMAKLSAYRSYLESRHARCGCLFLKVLGSAESTIGSNIGNVYKSHRREAKFNELWISRKLDRNGWWPSLKALRSINQNSRFNEIWFYLNNHVGVANWWPFPENPWTPQVRTVSVFEMGSVWGVCQLMVSIGFKMRRFCKVTIHLSLFLSESCDSYLLGIFVFIFPI